MRFEDNGVFVPVLMGCLVAAIGPRASGAAPGDKLFDLVKPSHAAGGSGVGGRLPHKLPSVHSH